MDSTFSISPLYHSFGTLIKDAFSDQTVVVTNTGDGILVVNPLPAVAAPFSVITDELSDATITPGDSSSMVLRFSPTALGDFSTTLDMSSNDPITPIYTFGMDGTAEQAIIAITPTFKSFGSHDQGTDTDQTVTVQNDGNVDLVVGSLSGLATPFSLVDDNVSSASIGSGDSSTVVVRYTPVAPGTFSDTLVIPSNDPVTPSSSFGVDGTSSGADVSVSPSSYDFGGVPSGLISDVLVRVSNLGDQTLVMSFVEGLFSPFSVIDDNVTGQVIQAGGSRTLSIRFLPRQLGSYSGTLNIGSNDPDQPSFPVTVTGSTEASVNHGSGSRVAVDGQIKDYAT